MRVCINCGECYTSCVKGCPNCGSVFADIDEDYVEYEPSDSDNAINFDYEENTDV